MPCRAVGSPRRIRRRRLQGLGIWRRETVRDAFSTQGVDVVFGAHLIGSRAVADGGGRRPMLVDLEQLHQQQP